MFFLRLGIHRWATVDRGSLDSLFQGFTTDRGFAWRLGETPPFDGLIMNYPQDPAGQGRSDDGWLAPRLAVFGSDRRIHPLEQPVTAEQLGELLCKLQVELLLKRSINGGHSAHVSLKASISDLRRIMLRTWPPASLLCDDPGRVHLAAILMERKCNLAELSALSGQSITQCDFFIQLVHRAGLVEHYPLVAIPHVATRLYSSSFASPPRGDFARDVFARTRRGLKRLPS
mgnify:CR=1 FL=1